MRVPPYATTRVVPSHARGGSLERVSEDSTRECCPIVRQSRPSHRRLRSRRIGGGGGGETPKGWWVGEKLSAPRDGKYPFCDLRSLKKHLLTLYSSRPARRGFDSINTKPGLQYWCVKYCKGLGEVSRIPSSNKLRAPQRPGPPSAPGKNQSL